MALEEEKEMINQKKERAKQEREDGLLEQNARLLKQLQEQRDRASIYKQKIAQLKDEKQIEMAKGQQREIDLATTRAELEDIKVELAEKLQENDALNSVNSSIKKHKSLSSEVADAIRMAEIASHERDRAKDKVSRLESKIRDMETQINAKHLDQRQVMLHTEIKSKQDQLVAQMRLQMKEDQRDFKAQLKLKEKELNKLRGGQHDRQLKAEQERDAALIEARALREKANQFRADTRELERQLYDLNKSHSSPRAASRATSRATTSPAGGMVGGLNAAIRIVHLEADVQRLRNQLHAHEATATSNSEAKIKALQNQLDFCKKQLEIGPPQPSDTSMLDTLYTRQAQVSMFRTANAHLRDFVQRAANGQASTMDAKQALARSEEHTTALEALPRGWDRKETEDGIEYYVDHSTRTTSWIHPMLQQYTQPSLLLAPNASILTAPNTSAMQQHHLMSAGANVSVIGPNDSYSSRRALQPMQAYPPAPHEKAASYTQSFNKLQSLRNTPRSAGAQ